MSGHLTSLHREPPRTRKWGVVLGFRERHLGAARSGDILRGAELDRRGGMNTGTVARSGLMLLTQADARRRRSRATIELSLRDRTTSSDESIA